jgi:osmotically inducible protein OsmC
MERAAQMTSRIATTHWTGGLMDGSGHVSLDSSGTGEYDVTFPRRVGEPEGTTSPEELIAAAHSACMAMNLSGTLGKAGLEPEYLDVRSEVTAGPPPGGGLAITGIVLTVRAKVPGVDPDQFAELAKTAEATCPVSKALAGTTITLDAALV